MGYASVLLVAQDELAKQALGDAFLKEGLEMLWACSGADAEQQADSHQPSLILLNPRLAPDDGWGVYRRLLRFGVPIMVLAADSPAVCRVALSLGAAECLPAVTPAHQIAACARSILGQKATSVAEIKSYAGIQLDISGGVARVGPREVALTPSECGLLAALIDAQGRVVSREQLVQRVRASAGALPLARSIDAHIRGLRRKLAGGSQEPALVDAVRGFGYRLASPDSRSAEGLGDAAFAASSLASLIIDANKHVHLMNRRAQDLLSPTPAADGSRTCAELLGCETWPAGDDSCPLRQASERNEPRHVSRHVHVGQESLSIEETVVPLSDEAGHFVLELSIKA